LNATETDHPIVGSSQLRLYANINETLFISLIDLNLLYPLTIILTSPSNLLPTFSVGQQILLDSEAYLLLYPVLVTLDLVASGWVEALPWAVQTVEYGYTTALSETITTIRPQTMALLSVSLPHTVAATLRLIG
jgi:hypothetical protein